jgi:DNA primase
VEDPVRRPAVAPGVDVGAHLFDRLLEALEVVGLDRGRGHEGDLALQQLARGDEIKFLRELDGLSFVEAIRAVAERQGIEIVETGDEDERRRNAEARRRRDELYTVGDAAARFYERMLREHPLSGLARAELERRGLTLDAAESSPMSESLDAFRMGYAPYAWDELAQHLKAGGHGVLAAEQVGLLVPRRTGVGHYDRFRHRLMFAIVDNEGRIVGFSGRSLEDPKQELLNAHGIASMGTPDAPPAKYVNSPESPIYKKRETVFGLHQARRAVRDDDCTIVVEGNFDVVGLHARGIRNVVAPLGTAFTTEQAKQLRRLSANIVLLFDGDSAGKRADRSAREPCVEAGLSARVALVPEGTDPDDMARTGGAEAVQKAVKAAKSLLEHLIDSALDRGFSADDALSRAKKIREVAELISADPDPTVRAMAERHADTIAERLGIADVRTFRALASVVQRAASQGVGAAPTRESARPAPPPERARSRDRRLELGQEILGALLDFPELLDMPDLADAAGALQGPTAAAIAALRQLDPEHTARNPELLLAKLPASIHPFAAARLAAPRHERVDDARSELLRNVEKLKRLELSRQKSEVMEELERIQSSGDFDREVALLREQERRARERHGL